MPRLLPLAFGVLLLGAFAAPPDEAAVRAAFEAYKKALLAADGEAAVAAVDRNTLGYYGRIHDLALRADSATVRALPSLDLLMVLLVRHRVPADSLRRMDGPALLAHGVDEGWIGRDGVEGQTLGGIRVDADTAYADVLIHGQPVPFAWTFHREDGQWRLDLTSTMGGISEALDGAIAETGMDREAFFFDMLGMLTGTPPDETIWIPTDPQ